LLLALGALAEAAPRVAEVDLNPVIVPQEFSFRHSPAQK
jgi:hypothetical protein